MNRRLIVACVTLALPACRTDGAAAARIDPDAEKDPQGVARTVAAVNQALREAWARENVLPAPPVDDARFIRRVCLDVVGTIPSAEAVRAFLVEATPDKRARLVESLLGDPRYGEHWSRYWEAALLGRTFREPIVDRAAFRDWLKTRFNQNAAWNTVAYDLIDAAGQNSYGGPESEMAAEASPPASNPSAMGGDVMTGFAAIGEERGHAPRGEAVNGAVNWLLRFDRNPADIAGTVSRVFLGVQIQCAQCHDHPTEKWTQQDFRRFAACFTRTRVERIDKGRVMGPRRVAVVDVNHPVRQGLKQNPDLALYLAARPAALDGTDLSGAAFPRQALAAWTTDAHNPWFAKATVNRLWAHFLGRGFVDPLDDFRDSNPATLPSLLSALADDFVASGYDLRHEIRVITSTDAYQRDSAPVAHSPSADRLWARYHLKALGPEELLNALVEATHLGPIIEEVAGDDVERLRRRLEQQFVFLFDVDEDSEQVEFEGTIPQALFLLNGQLVNAGSSAVPGAALAEVLALPGGDEPKIASLYLRTLSRLPAPDEVAYWKDFVNIDRAVATTVRQPAARTGPDPMARLTRRLAQPQQSPKLQAYEDLLWTLLNSSEFNFNR